MADFDSSLPVRTENNGDVAAKIVDGATPSQALAVDASGKITVKLDDAAGTGITSQANGGQQALDVGIDVGGVQIDPRQVRALTAADVVTANQGAPNTAANGWPVKPTDGTNSQTFTGAGEALVKVNELLIEDHNFGAVGASTLRTAAELGNAAGAIDYNYGTVGAQTIRVAAEPGNATGAADFNNGATGAQTLRVAANLAVAGANVTALNPVPVSITSTTVGTEVNDYKTVASLAANATDNHDYTITAAKTFKGRMFWASGSGMIKAEVQISADGTTFVTKWVGFSSTATPNIEIQLDNLTVSESGTGSKIRIIITNRDKQAQDVYSTISGTEV